MKNEGEKQLMVMIQSYRDDPDLQNLIDWIQRHWLHCCGVNNYRNWESNIYFNCSSKLVGSVEACGVPASCCRMDYFHVRLFISCIRVINIFRTTNNVVMEHWNHQQ